MADEKIVSDERLYNYLRAYAKTTKLTTPKFHISEGSNKGDNYVGRIYRVTIEGVQDGEMKKIQLILKTTQTPSSLLGSSKVTKMFEREIFFYREILPTFKGVVKGCDGIVVRFPILYDANEEPGKEILMLENLTPQGFTMAKSKILDYPHLSLALRCLGEFHGYSFIMRTANPTSFEKLKRMKEPLFFEQSTLDKRRDTIRKRLVNVVLKALVNEDKHYSERYQQFADNITQTMIDMTDGRTAEPYAVVNHGDFWTNNMLFKYDQEKNPCDLRLVDLQICRYASPVLDIIYLLFCCCTQETRSKYYDQIIHEYYEALSKCIERAGYDSKILFPYEALSQHLIKFGKYAAGMATYTLHIFATKNEELESIYNTDILNERVENDSFYRNMLIGTFKDLVDKNYI